MKDHVIIFVPNVESGFCTADQICLRMGARTNSEKRKMIPLHFVLISENSKIRKRSNWKMKRIINV